MYGLSLNHCNCQFRNGASVTIPENNTKILGGFMCIVTMAQKKLVPPDGGWGYAIIVAYALNQVQDFEIHTTRNLTTDITITLP